MHFQVICSYLTDVSFQNFVAGNLCVEISGLQLISVENQLLI